MLKESLKEAIETFDDPPPEYPPMDWKAYWDRRYTLHPEQRRLPGEGRIAKHRRLGTHPKASPHNKRFITRDPRVINMIASGVPLYEIARKTGMATSTLRRHLRRSQIKALVEREGRRILEHLRTRKLEKVPYEKLLAGSLNAIRTVVELNYAEKPVEERISRDTIREISIAIFGFSQSEGRPALDAEARVLGGGTGTGSAHQLGPGATGQSSGSDRNGAARGLSREP